MKVHFQSPSITVTVTNDAGQEIYHYSADQVLVNLDTQAAIKAAEEIMAQVKAAKDKLDTPE